MIGTYNFPNRYFLPIPQQTFGMHKKIEGYTYCLSDSLLELLYVKDILSERQYKALCLHVLGEGLTYPEIGQKLKINEANAKALLDKCHNNIFKASLTGDFNGIEEEEVRQLAKAVLDSHYENS